MMYCEECGNVMQWRSTNHITNISKFKCLHCGHVDYDIIEVKPYKEYVPKYYHYNGTSWIVKRTINYEKVYVGAFATESIAQRVVEAMAKIAWDKDNIPIDFEELGIHKDNRRWVCV